MPNEPNLNDPINLWQSQEVEKMTITLDQIRSRSSCFERRLYWRNIREYAGGAIALALLTPQLWSAHSWRLASVVLLITGLLYVMWQVYLRGARPAPADAAIRPLLEFHRRELERQRDALRSVWRWYLLPFAPGLALTLIALALDRGIHAAFVLSGIIFVVAFAGVWLLNDRAARKLDRKIDEMKSLETD
jgi:hypothetical protein